MVLPWLLVDASVGDAAVSSLLWLAPGERVMSPQRRRREPTVVVDADDQVIEVGGHCGLYIDLQPEDSAPMRGDWVATEAGSRYLVDDVRLVKSRRHAQIKRYQMRVLRLPKHASPPVDVHVIWLRWYPRGRRS